MLLTVASTLAIWVLAFFGLQEVAPLPPSTGTLIVRVQGVPSDAGHILVALYKKESDWTKPLHADYTRKVPASKGTVEADFANLEVGEYAVAVVHDADNSGDMTTSALGLPKEAYGFGNNARGVFGPPSFGESRISFTGKNAVEITIK